MSCARIGADVVRIAAVALVAWAALAAAAAAAGELDAVGRWPYGPSLAVAVSPAGDVAYFGSGTVLEVADVRVPTEPQILGEVVLPGVVSGITVEGEMAYVADRDGGFRIVDVSTPWAPLEVASRATPGPANSVAVRTYGGQLLAYVAHDGGGLSLYNVSTPALPFLLGSIEQPGWDSTYVALNGGFAYLSVTDVGLWVVSVGDPTQPQDHGGYYPVYGGAFGQIGVGDAYTYLCMNGPVQVFHTHPASSLDREGEFYPVSRVVDLVGDRAYLGNWWGGLAIMDITNPVSPAPLGSLGSMWFVDAAVAGDLVFTACDAEGLGVADVSTPTAPADLGRLHPAGRTYAVAVEGDRAAIARDDDGVVMIDVSTPQSPFAVGFYRDSSSDGPVQVAVRGNLAVASWTNGLRVLDIADPTAPYALGSFPTPLAATSIAFAGDIVYLALNANGLQGIDVSDPAAPVQAFTLPGVHARRMVVVGQRAYVTHWSGGTQGAGVTVLDVTTPAAPVAMGTFLTSAEDVAAAGDLAFVAAGLNGVRVVDFSIPASPHLVGLLDSWDNDVERVAVAGDHLYVYDAKQDEIQQVDVSDPTSPVVIASRPTSVTVRDLKVADGYVYVAHDEAGLEVLQDWAPILWDDFESGDTSRWSAAVGN